MNPETALKHYKNVIEASKRYYERNKQAIAEKRKQKYREAHPEPKPRGRPKKVVSVEENV